MSADGRQLLVGFEAGGVASGCTAFGDVAARESADEVDLTVRSLRREVGMCTDDLRLLRGVVELEQPLAGRQLVGCGHDACHEMLAGTEFFDFADEPRTDALGLTVVDPTTVVAVGVVPSGFEADNVEPLPPASGLVAVDVRDGTVRWATPFARTDADDPLGRDAWSDGTWVVGPLTNSAGQVIVDASTGDVAALQNGFAGGVSDLLHGRWFGIQKLTPHLVAVDLGGVAAAWTGPRPLDFGAGERWRVADEYTVGATDDAVATVGGGTLRLRSPADGSVMGGGPLPSGAGMISVNGDLAVTYAGGAIVGLEPATTAVRWQVDAPEVTAMEATPAGVVAVDSGGVTFVAHDGSSQWHAGLLPVAGVGDGAVDEPPVAVGDGLVVVSTAEGDAVAFDADSGAERWRVRLADDQRLPVARGGRPVVVGDTVVVTTWDRLIGLRIDDGARLWETLFTESLDD